MPAVRRARIAEFGVPYRHPQAVPFEDRVDYIIDREIYVGGTHEPRGIWHQPFMHVVAALLLIIILLVAIMGTGHSVDVFRP